MLTQQEAAVAPSPRLKVDHEGAELWRPEWLMALLPLIAWLFAYYYERGMFLQAEVPSALFDVTFARMLALSTEIAFPIAMLCFGASSVAQRVFGKSRLKFLVTLTLWFGAAAGMMVLNGNADDALWRPAILVGSFVLGFFLRSFSGPGTIVAQIWASGYLRAVFVTLFCILGGLLAQQLGQKVRRDQTVFAVLERPCGPMIEVFRIHGDSVILVPLEFGSSRTGLASLSALGEVSIRFAWRDEVRHRINFVGPCKPFKPESLGLTNKS